MYEISITYYLSKSCDATVNDITTGIDNEDAEACTATEENPRTIR